jgi:5-aminopentanamidase
MTALQANATPGRSLCLALLQAPSPMADVAEGLQTIIRALTAAGAAGATMLVVPEAYLPGYNQPDIAHQALPRQGAWTDALAAACKATQCGLCLGYAERGDGAIFNAAVVFDAHGQRIGDYRKIQLYGDREKRLYTPGDRYTLFDLDGIKTAVLICYDVEFAPHVAALAAMGVCLILVPTANMEPFHHVVRATVPAMAANHGLRIVYANYCGTEGDLTYIGGSLIVAEDGRIVAQAGQSPALLIAEMPVVDGANLSTQAADYRAIRSPS